MAKPVIVWDVDDVLNDLTRQWYHDYSLSPEISYDGLTSNPPCDILKITMADYLNSLDDFRRREMMNLKPAPEVLAWFSQYGDRYNNIALTAVPFKFAHLSADWVIKHFGNWIRTFHFVPSPRPDDKHVQFDVDKTDFLRRLNRMDLFIDDSEKNVLSAEQAGFACAVFPRPWNRNCSDSVADFLNEILI